MLYHSGHILVVARRAYERSLSDSSEAMPAIILAALSVECFLNDLAERFSMDLFRTECGEYSDAAHWLGVLETSKASTLKKIEAVYFVFRKVDIDRGAQPYQDVRLLFQLRNELAHRKPESTGDWGLANREKDHEPHKYVKELASRGIIELPPPNAPPVWSQFVLTASTAKWSYNTATGMMQFLTELFPPGKFSEISKLLMRGVELLP